MPTRKNCVVCAGEDLKVFYTIPNFPIRLGVDDCNEVCSTLDMTWSECQKCGCSQLVELIELDKLYEKHHNASIGGMWERHHEELSRHVSESITGDGVKILEIGGANLLLANKVCSKSSHSIGYTIVDLASGQYDVKEHNERIHLKCLKISEYVTDEKFDVVVHSHTLEHFYDPVETLLMLRELLKEDGKMIVSIPNLSSQVQAGHLNSLHFEHTYYYDDVYLDYMLSRSGFAITEVVPFSKWNNFYICKKVKIASNLNLVYRNESKRDIISMMTSLREFVEDVKKVEGKVFSFGAHIFSQYLFSFGLYEKIQGVLDNDVTKNKQGNTLAGTKIPVFPVSHIENLNAPTVVLKAAQFYEEISRQIIDTNNTAKILC